MSKLWKLFLSLVAPCLTADSEGSWRMWWMWWMEHLGCDDDNNNSFPLEWMGFVWARGPCSQKTGLHVHEWYMCPVDFPVRLPRWFQLQGTPLSLLSLWVLCTPDHSGVIKGSALSTCAIINHRWQLIGAHVVHRRSQISCLGVNGKPYGFSSQLFCGVNLCYIGLFT